MASHSGSAAPARYEAGTGRLSLPTVYLIQEGYTETYEATLATPTHSPDRFVLQTSRLLEDREEEDDAPLFDPQIGRLYLPRVLVGTSEYEAELTLIEGSAPLTFQVTYAAPRPKRELGVVFRHGAECLGEEAAPAHSRDVYVSPEGDDSRPGTSEQPWRTLTRALCALTPGQTLHILPGTYRESVALGAFGDDSEPIVIRGETTEGDLPVLEGDNQRTFGIALVESRNLIVENLVFQHYTDEGMYLLNTDTVTIRNCRFVDNGRHSIDPDFQGEGFGLAILGGQNVTIEANELSGNGPDSQRWRASILGMGINTFELRDSVIRDNTIHDTIGGGILVEDGDNVRVEGNLIYANELNANGDYWDGGIWVDGGRNIQVIGNTLTGNHGPGITLSDSDNQYPHASLDYLIENNQITENLFGVYIWNFLECPPPETAVRLVDNRIADNPLHSVYCSETFTYVPDTSR